MGGDSARFDGSYSTTATWMVRTVTASILRLIKGRQGNTHTKSVLARMATATLKAKSDDRLLRQSCSGGIATMALLCRRATTTLRSESEATENDAGNVSTLASTVEESNPPKLTRPESKSRKMVSTSRRGCAKSQRIANPTAKSHNHRSSLDLEQSKAHSAVEL